MKPVDQTEFLGPDGGVKRGNCLMAAVASIIEVPLETMPVLDNGHDDGTWWDVLLNALYKRGYTALYWTNAGPEFLPFNPYGYHVANGPSPRGPHGHSTVALDGKIVHDPHPSRAGIEKITSWILIYPIARLST